MLTVESDEKGREVGESGVAFDGREWEGKEGGMRELEVPCDSLEIEGPLDECRS